MVSLKTIAVFVRFKNLSVQMKSIFTIISSVLFIAGSVFSDMFLSDGNKHVPVVIKQYAYEPVNTHMYNLKIESLPFDKCNTEKQVEGSHVTTTRFATFRKIILRHPSIAPLSFLSKHSSTVLPKINKLHSNFIGYKENNLPLHVLNCSWLI